MASPTGAKRLALVAGRVVSLELKRERGGRVSCAPRRTHAAMTEACAYIHTVHGLDEALRVLVAWGMIRPDVGSPAACSRAIAAQGPCVPALSILRSTTKSATIRGCAKINRQTGRRT